MKCCFLKNRGKIIVDEQRAQINFSSFPVDTYESLEINHFEQRPSNITHTEYLTIFQQCSFETF